MTDKSKKEPLDSKNFAKQVGLKAERIVKAKHNITEGVWFGLGMFGLIGWSIVIPTIIGISIGLWLDKNYPSKHYWTLILLTSGLSIGCINAWLWIAKEYKAMHEENTENENE